MKKVLLKHYKLYPEMQIQDAVKLIYQNEFGVGHLIKDEKTSLERLREEAGQQLSQLSLSDPEMPLHENPALFEDLGNGLSRLHLRALDNTGLDLSTVNRFLIYTASSVMGSTNRFEEKLNVLACCCKNGELPFSCSDLETYLQSYKNDGYPPVSHSKKYRDAYQPSYRVVMGVFRDFFKIFARIDILLKSKDRVTVAIDGNSGSGKSTLSDLLRNIYDCNVFHMDSFFLPPELKTEARLKEVGGNVDYVRFRDEIIEGLKTGNSFTYRPYNCKTQALEEPVQVFPKRLNIIEGVYSHHPVLASYYDLKVFLHTDSATQRERILKRSGASMLQRFLKEWIPLEDRYFQELNIAGKSDLVFKR